MTRSPAFLLAGSGIRGSAGPAGTGIVCDRRGMRDERACQHQPRCPGASAPDRTAARVVACHPGQGWSLLCNGVVLFDDAGILVPDPSVTTPGRAPALPKAA